MFTEIEIQRLSAGTVYKLVAVGLACSMVPLFAFFGVLAAFGARTMTWNGQHLTGLGGLAMAPVAALMVTAIGTLFLGSAIAIGLWLFSFVRPMGILVKTAQAPDAR